MGFTFNTVPSIISAPGAIARLGEIARARLGPYVLMVTDPGLVRLGIVARALAPLEAEGIACTVFDQVEADPPDTCVLAAVAAAKACGATGIIGFGGGSSIDVAKLVALVGKSPRRRRLPSSPRGRRKRWASFRRSSCPMSPCSIPN